MYCCTIYIDEKYFMWNILQCVKSNIPVFSDGVTQNMFSVLGLKMFFKIVKHGKEVQG